MSSLLSLPLFAQKQITEIRVIDSEKESVIESATLQWRALGSSLYLNSAVFFLVRKFYMLRCLLGALYFDMRRFGVFWVFSKHKIPRPNQWGSMKNHKK